MWMPGKQNHFHVRLSDFSFYSITTGKNTAIGGERQDTEWVLTWQPKSRAFAYLNSLLCGSLHVEACLCVRVWLYLLCVCVPVCMSLQHPTMKINLQREMRMCIRKSTKGWPKWSHATSTSLLSVHRVSQRLLYVKKKKKKKAFFHFYRVLAVFKKFLCCFPCVIDIVQN